MSGGGGSRIKIEFPDEAAAAAGDKSPSSDHRHQHQQHLDKSPSSDEHAEEKIVQADDDVHTDNERGEEEADEVNNESQVEDEEEEKSKVLGEGFYEIEAIRKKRVHKGQVQYLIKWKNYPESANTWEPYDNLELIADVVDAFEQRSNSSSSRSSKKRRRQLAMQKAWAAKRSPGKNEQRNEERCVSVKAASERGRGRPRGSKGRGRPPTTVETPVPKRNPRRRKITTTDKSPPPPADEHEQPQVEMNMTTTAAAIVSVTTSREGKQEKEREKEKEKEEANVMNNEGAKGANLSLMSVPVLLPHSQTPITGAKKRKSGCVKRFVQQQQQEGEDEGETTNSSLKQQQGRQEQQVDSNSTEAVVVSKGKGDPSPSITKILRTVQMDAAAAANSNQATSITFQALRSDGSHVLIDNHHLKATNPLLLIDFYERIIQFNPKA